VTTETVDVLVVGAGMAGLVAARRLSAAGHLVGVLEARDRVGGRVLNWTVPDSGGEVVEAGGQWVGPGQERIHALLDELGLTTFPTYDQGRHTAEFDGRLRHYRGRVPWLGARATAEIALTWLRLDRAARRIDPAAPWLARHASALDGQTFADWLAERLSGRTASNFYQVVTEAVFAAGPGELSALWALHYIAAAGGLDRLVNTSGGAQQDRVTGGSQRICLELAAGLGGAVSLNAVVTRVEWSADRVEVSTADGRQYRARRLVLAVPPALANEIEFVPPLPSTRSALWSGLPMGSVIKMNFVYDRPFWRDAGLSGQAAGDSRTLNTVFDNSPPSGSPGVLVGFVEGRHAQRAARLSTAERRIVVLADLASYFGPAAAKPVAVHELDWCAQRFSGGCYGAFAVPGVLSRHGAQLRDPVGPIHVAGTETARRWTGYLDGAVESGEHAAQQISAGLATPSRAG